MSSITDPQRLVELIAHEFAHEMARESRENTQEADGVESASPDDAEKTP